MTFFEFTLKKSILPISLKISTFEEKVFCFRFLWIVFSPICSKISTFLEKHVYFLKKKTFYAEKSNISIKRIFSWDHFEKTVLCRFISLKISTFEEKDFYLYLFEKLFIPISSENQVILRSLWEIVFDHISKNVNISRKRTVPWDRGKGTFRQKWYFLEIILIKIVRWL